MPSTLRSHPSHPASLATADSVSDATLQSLAALYTASVSTSERKYEASISATVAAVESDATSPSDDNVLPYFDFDVQRNLTVTVGQTGFLHCRVERLGDKDVSLSSSFYISVIVCTFKEL